VLFTPDSDGEQFIAFTEGGALIGGILEVIELNHRHAQAIEDGEPGAINDIFSPVEGLGYFRVIAGTAILGKNIWTKTRRTFQIVSDNIFETSSER